MPRSEPKKKKKAHKKNLLRLPAEPEFTPGELALLYEEGAVFGELCFVRVASSSRAEVEVVYYGSPLRFRPGRRGGVWASKDGRWRLERRNPERVAASLRLRAGGPGVDGCGDGAANERSEV